MYRNFESHCQLRVTVRIFAPAQPRHRLPRGNSPIYGVCDVSGARGRVIITQPLTTPL
nr:MAG TPA: hypothetical protein [Caudoviricetes sp.]